jgi:hypothetical protein
MRFPADRVVAAVKLEHLIDVAGLVGAALIAFGAWQIYEPAGWIVGGFELLTGAVLLSRK